MDSRLRGNDKTEFLEVGCREIGQLPYSFLTPAEHFSASSHIKRAHTAGIVVAMQWGMKLASKPTFGQLVDSIRQADHYFSSQANRAVNVNLTLRNWVIGHYIAEFELRGQNRAIYGKRLLSELANKLTSASVSNCNKRQLSRYLRFSRLYPQIGGTLSPQFKDAVRGQRVKAPTLPVEQLISKLSYSHFELIFEIADSSKRAFYEIECIRGNWSVRDLKRQIASLYFERNALSTNTQKLTALVRKNIQTADTKLNIRDPYVFEFLGVKAQEVMAESALEGSLLNKLHDFLLELGHGFCFEACQKRILIDGKHYFVDLVFYHRILKCHVLIELKVDEFNHEHLGQLNTYVSWFKKNMMEVADNPPIGILLCTKKDHALVEYALAGISNTLFVSKYQVELPKKEEIENFLNATLKEIE